MGGLLDEILIAFLLLDADYAMLTDWHADPIYERSADLWTLLEQLENEPAWTEAKHSSARTRADHLAKVGGRLRANASNLSEQLQQEAIIESGFVAFALEAHLGRV
jgi:predicted LPLAT superfamily acyltransferase